MSKTLYTSMKPRLIRFLMATATVLAVLGMELQSANAWVLTSGDASGAGTKLDVAHSTSGGLAAQLSCVKHPDAGNYSVISLTADVGALQDGAPSKVTLYTQGGAFDFQGIAVKRSNSGGLDGIAFSVTNNDPLWKALSSSSVADYQVDQTSAVRLDLAPSQGKIDKFVSLCSNVSIKKQTQAAVDISGLYTVKGTNPPGASAGDYTGEVLVQDGTAGKQVKLEWNIGGSIFRGIGELRDGKVLYITYQGSFSGDATLQLNEDKTLSGTWKAAGSTAVGTEIWTKKQAVSQANQPQKGATATVNPAEATAFQFAQQMNTPQAYNLFIKTYPNSPLVAMAQAALGQSGAAARQQKTESPAKPAVTSAPLEPYMTKPGKERWKFNTSDSGFDATVENAGVRLQLSCPVGKPGYMAIAVDKSAAGKYPELLERLSQGANANPVAKISFDSGSSYDVPMAIEATAASQSLKGFVDPNTKFINDVMQQSVITLRADPFGAAFKLKASKDAVCKLSNQCGIEVDGCAGQANANATSSQPKSKKKVTVCKSRSVYVEGRGCILKKYAKGLSKKSSKNRKRRKNARVKCKSRSVYVQGRGCILRKYAN